MIRYIIGLLLCIAVCLVYAGLRKETWRETFKDAGIVLLYVLAAIFGLAAAVYAVCIYA